MSWRRFGAICWTSARSMAVCASFAYHARGMRWGVVMMMMMMMMMMMIVVMVMVM
jgi:hypothetical protein